MMRTSHLNVKFRTQTCTVLISSIRVRVWILWTRLFSIVAEDNSNQFKPINYCQRRKKRIAGRRILDKSSKEFFLCVISTGLLYCKVDAAVRHHTGTSSTEWRYGKRCKGQKIYTCYILRLCGVFSLLIANILCCFCQDHWWNYLVISFMVFHIDTCVSQFIPQSLIYCSNMRHIWQTVMEHIWLVRNKKELIQNIFLWWRKKPFQQYSLKNDTY